MSRNILVVMEQHEGKSSTYPNVFCRIIDVDHGQVTPVLRIQDESRPRGNPYLVFGKLVQAHINGHPTYKDCTITVAEVCSGNLRDHFVYPADEKAVMDNEAAAKAAVEKFRDENGRTWKHRLRQLWTAGQDEGPLRLARNIIGSSGLDNF